MISLIRKVNKIIFILVIILAIIAVVSSCFGKKKLAEQEKKAKGIENTGNLEATETSDNLVDSEVLEVSQDKLIPDDSNLDSKSNSLKESNLANDSKLIEEEPSLVEKDLTEEPIIEEKEKEEDDVEGQMVEQNDSYNFLNESYIEDKTFTYNNIILKIINKFNLNAEQQEIIKSTILEQAKKQNFNPILLASLIEFLSAYNSDFAKENKYGLLLLSEQQAKNASEKLQMSFENTTDLKNPQYSITVGTFIFRELTNKYSGSFDKIIYEYLLEDATDIDSAIENESFKSVLQNFIDVFNVNRNITDDSIGANSETENVKDDEIVSLKNDVVKVDPPLEVETEVEAKEANTIDKSTSKEDSSSSSSTGSDYKSFIMISLDWGDKDTIKIEKIVDELIATAKLNDINPLLLTAIVWNESGFDYMAKGKNNKAGLMQINPVFGSYYAALTSQTWEPEKMYDTNYNLNFATKVLKFLFELFNGKLELVLASYNWDIKKVTDPNFNGSLPEDVAKYIRLVKKQYEELNKEFNSYKGRE